MTSIFGTCVDKGCPNSKKIEYADYRAWFGHYHRKGRDTLIQLAIKEGISKNPYGEPTYILANKLVKITKINSRDEMK